MSERIFFVVWNETTGYTRVRHKFIADAKDEATRMAGEHKGQRFHVLASLGYAEIVDPVKWVDLDRDADDGIPF